MYDARVCFVLPGGAQSLVGGAGAEVQIGVTLDLLGVGVGQAPPSIIGNAFGGFYGVDPGIGKAKTEIEITFSTAMATGNAATAEFVVQYAPDTGAAGGYAAGTWEDAETTGAHTATEWGTANAVRMDVPPAPPSTPNPRYVRLILRVPAATNMNAGVVNFAGLVYARTDLVNRFAPNNYVTV